MEFDEYVRSPELDLMEQRGTGLYMEQGQLLVDQIFRYEDLGLAMKAIAQQLDFGPVGFASYQATTT